MAAPTVGPCSPWITDDDLDAGTCCADGPTLSRAATIASTILFRLSGRQFPGICEKVVRPCGTGCASWQAWPAYRNHWWNAERTAMAGWQLPAWPMYRGGGGCAGGCRVPSVTLPGPVAAVNEVLVDGQVVDPSAYRVREYRHLERLDGYSWPCTQSLLAEPDQPGTFQVTYLYGRLPGDDGLAAAREYACEIAKASCPAASGECKLPERTRTVVRQGLSIDIMTPLDFLDKGRTGLVAVDLWLTSVNPARLPRRAAVSRLDA